MSKLNNPIVVKREFWGRQLSLETGRLAKQAHGSVYVKYGETSALVTVVSAQKAKEGTDFFPLTVEFQEKFSAAGRIPGGFFRREGRPSEWATLNARMVDRPIRPLFPEGYRNETQVVITLMSYDNENEVENITTLGASAALLISDVPFETAVASVRVGRVDGKLVINPKVADVERSDINVLVAGSRDSIMMVEGGADRVSEEEFIDAVFFGHQHIGELLDLQEELRKLAGKQKRSFTQPPKDEVLAAQIAAHFKAPLKQAMGIKLKADRYARIEQLHEECLQKFTEGLAGELLAERAKVVDEFFKDVKKTVARELTFEGLRIDGRAFDQVRPIEVEAGWLPRTHGSALFTRGETQAHVTVTLGTSDDEQMLDNVKGKSMKKYMLHYSFPPFCVGETGRFGGNSRREIGHSALAERAVAAILPDYNQFPYTIRVASEIFESNGSSSMATVCGASMALMDAGVPVKEAVAGIAMGLMSEGDKVCILSDILGDEDHLGDMDFKVCGTHSGVTAVQMDIKIKGIGREIMQKALLQAKDGRLHILKEMEKAINAPRAELSIYAPRITTIRISQERIKDLIGPGGKNIKGIVTATGCKIDIDQSGLVNVFSTDPAATEKAIHMIRQLTAEPEVGQVYNGTVKKIMEFGAFVEILPGTEGLVHISELDHRRVANVTDILQEGDEVAVKLLEIDRQGRLRLSRKALLPNNSSSEKSQ